MHKAGKDLKTNLELVLNVEERVAGRVESDHTERTLVRDPCMYRNVAVKRAQQKETHNSPASVKSTGIRVS
jgi:hypothetical protein